VINRPMGLTDLEWEVLRKDFKPPPLKGRSSKNLNFHAVRHADTVC